MAKIYMLVIISVDFKTSPVINGNEMITILIETLYSDTWLYYIICEIMWKWILFFF